MDMAALRADDLLSPLGRSPGRPAWPLARRLAGLEGKRIGLLDNSKQNAGRFLDAGPAGGPLPGRRAGSRYGVPAPR